MECCACQSISCLVPTKMLIVPKLLTSVGREALRVFGVNLRSEVVLGEMKCWSGIPVF